MKKKTTKENWYLPFCKRSLARYQSVTHMSEFFWLTVIGIPEVVVRIHTLMQVWTHGMKRIQVEHPHCFSPFQLAFLSYAIPCPELCLIYLFALHSEIQHANYAIPVVLHSSSFCLKVADDKGAPSCSGCCPCGGSRQAAVVSTSCLLAP